MHLVCNTILNLTTQEGQVACFENAAAHLGSGGRFVIEARVPELQRLPLGSAASTTTSRPTAGCRPARRRCATRGPPSWTMARLGGMRLEHRWAGWGEEPFTGLSPSHVSVYAKD